MANVLSILSEIENLSLYQQTQILALLEERLISGSQITQVTKDVKETRFSKGKVCPYCKGENILRNGKYNNKQRYIAKIVERHLLISLTLQHITAKKLWINGLNMLNAC